MAYLDDHDPSVRQFRDRGTTPSGVIVLHTAESQADVIGPDTGAEGVAAFIAARTTYGSYHFLCDSDSIVDVVRLSQQAYGDGTGSNPHAIHISAAIQAATWPRMPREWREATVRNMARAAVRADAYVHSIHGVHVPARRITRAESDRRVEGFISHGERDPGRRSDPGASFPWELFLETYADLRNPPPPPKPDPTRGPVVNRALPVLSDLLELLNTAKAADGTPRAARLEEATDALEDARRALRRIRILNAEDVTP